MKREEGHFDNLVFAFGLRGIEIERTWMHGQSSAVRQKAVHGFMLRMLIYGDRSYL